MIIASSQCSIKDWIGGGFLLPPINSKGGLFEHQLVHPGHGDQSTKEEADMCKKSEDQTSNLAGYIRWREKKDNLKNVFFEPIGSPNSSREQLMFNLVTALINNGFKPSKEVADWYAKQLKLCHK